MEGIRGYLAGEIGTEKQIETAGEEEYEVIRIAGFSDAVFAVAITLLVPNVDVPLNAGKNLGS